MQENQWLTSLELNKLMQSPGEVLAFETALEEITKEDNLESLLPRLHLLLDNRCAQPEVLFGLIHLLESVDASAQLSAFVTVVPQLIFSASEWVQILHTRILNDGATCQLYYEILHSFNQDQPNFIRQLLEESISYHLSNRSQVLESA